MTPLAVNRWSSTRAIRDVLVDESDDPNAVNETVYATNRDLSSKVRGSEFAFPRLSAATPARTGVVVLGL